MRVIGRACLQILQVRRSPWPQQLQEPHRFGLGRQRGGFGRQNTCLYSSTDDRNPLAKCKTLESACESPNAAEATYSGRVVSAQANFVRVQVLPQDGNDNRDLERPSLLCTVRQLLKKTQQTIMVGDFVAISGVDWIEMRGVVMDRLPRKSGVSKDPPVANVDILLIVFALDRPMIDINQLSRFLVAAEATNIPSLLVALTKTDLVSSAFTEEIANAVQEWGYQTFPVSAKTGQGLSDLYHALLGQTSVLAGPSGVGKSSLINLLAPANDDFLLSVGEVSDRTGRGKHTTRHVSLTPLALPTDARANRVFASSDTKLQDSANVSENVGTSDKSTGLLADSPGFSQPDLVGRVSARELSLLFPSSRNEICAFRNCLHVNEPGCKVKHALGDRYHMYLSLLGEIQKNEDKQKAIERRAREAGGVKIKGGKIEPKLSKKKHRRSSRKVENRRVQRLIEEEEEASLLYDPS